jgi:hypothetical protein
MQVELKVSKLQTTVDGGREDGESGEAHLGGR